MQIVRILPVTVALSLGACAMQTPEAAGIEEPITETAVTLHANGTFTTVTREVSVEEQLAELGELDLALDDDAVGVVLAPLVSVDSECAGASMWLYDQLNRTGNRLCLKREGELGGYLDLGSVTHHCGLYGYPPKFECFSWRNTVRSFWAGSDSGRFLDNETWPGSYWFSAYEQQNTANATVAAADRVMLNPVIQ